MAQAQQIPKTTVLLDGVTLTGGYNGLNTAVIDLGTDSDQANIYIRWAGRVDARLYCKVQFSPTNEIYYNVMHELIDTADNPGVTQLIAKEYFWKYNGTNYVYREELGLINSGRNNAGGRLKFDIIPPTGSTPVIYHDGTAFTTVTERANTAAFSTPATQTAATAEWSLDAGVLNFRTSDLTLYANTMITADYINSTDTIRLPIPIRDRFMKISFKEYAGSGGTLSAYLDSNWG